MRTTLAFDAPTDALKRALLDAESVVYNKASTGLYLEKLLERPPSCHTIWPLKASSW